MDTGYQRYLSKTRPTVSNVKTAKEVPAINGEDYINPEYSRRLEEESLYPPEEEQIIDNTSFTQQIGTGLPENVPGHDSILLTKYRTDTMTPKKTEMNQLTKASSFARSRNVGGLPQSRTEVPKSVSFNFDNTGK